MKKVILLWCFCGACWGALSAQEHVMAPFGTYIFATDQGSLFGFDIFPEGTLVDVEITVKNGDVVWYIENHTGIPTDDVSHISMIIGGGMLSPQSPLPELLTEFVARWDNPIVCYKFVVHDGSDDHIIEGMLDYYYEPIAVYSNHSRTADALMGYPVSDDAVSLQEGLGTEGGFLMGIFDDEIKKVEGDILEMSTAPSAVTGEDVHVMHSKLFDDADAVSTGGSPNPVESQYTHCSGPLVNFYNGYEFKRPLFNMPQLDHATAAVYAENIYDALGVGLFAKGASRGSYNQGQTGMLALSTGIGNGAAAWGRVAQAPDTGGYKYGLLGEDQSFSDSWAAAIFGDGFYTGTWSQASDRRLKTEIHAAEQSLSTVMQLRPAQYHYIENTPYNLPTGIHHGFIAQEMEEVLPELVSNITMPGSLDPDKVNTSESATYKAVNYIELIPILTSALQELSQIVEKQGKEIERLNALLGVTAEKPR